MVNSLVPVYEIIIKIVYPDSSHFWKVEGVYSVIYTTQLSSLDENTIDNGHTCANRLVKAENIVTGGNK